MAQLLTSRAGSADSLQRVPVTAPTREETLFNQRGTPGQAAAGVYGDASGATFDMARAGAPEVVTTTVRIRFVQQNRTLSAADASGNQHPVDTGTASVIPPGDARRPFAQNICDTAPPHWDNRAVLAGTRAATTFPQSVWNSDAGGPVRLPLRFKAVPVFDLPPVPADKQIRVFPMATQAGGPIHPIDAGHYYMNKGPNYAGFNDEAIYAHEYGHLIGMADEYSQSNPQMHAMLHGIDPATAAERSNAMDREAVRRMVLAALTRPLHDRVNAATGEIAHAFTAGRAPVVGALAASLHTGLGSPSVKVLLAANTPPTHASLLPSLNGFLDAAARRFNTNAVASRVVAAELGAGQLGALIRQLYFSALSAAAAGSVDVGGINMSIAVEGNAGIAGDGNPVIPSSGLWSGTGAPAADIGATVDRVAGTLRTGRVPPVRASGAVLRELSSLPAGWAGFRAAAPASLAGSTLTTDLNTALLASWMGNLTSAAPAPIARRRALRRAVNSTIQAAAQTAATNAVRAFLQSELEPVMRTTTMSLMTAIGDEVTRIMGTAANQLALNSPRDPAIASLASSMRTQLQAQATAAQAAQTSAGTTALDPGATAPAQQVTYSTVNMMSDNTDIFRPDQFTHLATVFNNQSSLKRDREGPFHIEMGPT